MGSVCSRRGIHKPSKTMISAIVVILVGIGFTRLTMLALEMRDEDDLFDSAPAETLQRKEIIIERMRAMKKPRVLVVTGEDQCKLPEADLIARTEERERENDIFAGLYSSGPRLKEEGDEEEPAESDEEKVSEEEPLTITEVSHLSLSWAPIPSADATEPPSPAKLTASTL